MISNGRLYSNHKISQLTPIFLLLLLIPVSQSALYSYGRGFGDEKIDWTTWSRGTEQINLDTSIPLLGNGRLSSVWINTVGALTYRELSTDSNIDSVVDNIVLAPYFIQSREGAIGAVYYRQTTTDLDLLGNIADDVSEALIVTSDVTTLDFTPTYALIVTWSNVVSVQDPNKQNTFQIILTTDGARSFAIYNYDDPLEWGGTDGNYAAAGIFATPNPESSCYNELQGSRTAEVTDLPRTIGNTGELGKFVLLISEKLTCSSKLQTACAEALPSSEWGTSQGYFSITGNSWDVYAQHTCNNDFEIRPGVNTERIDCVYEPDYYESAWEREPAKCIDLTATKTFEIDAEIIKIGNDTEIAPGNLTEEDYAELGELIERAFEQILNLTDIIVDVMNISKEPDSPFSRSETLTPDTIGVKIRVHIPPYVHKKITVEKITEIITKVLVENDEVGGLTINPIVDVTESTDECLQGCMCRFAVPKRVCPRGKFPQIQPDSCCGGCNGKPYSSTIKACCNNEKIYNPLKARCCNGRVRRGATGPCP